MDRGALMESALKILCSPIVLFRFTFVIPLLLGKNSNSVAWMFLWCYVGIGIFKHFRKDYSPKVMKSLRKLYSQPPKVEEQNEVKEVCDFLTGAEVNRYVCFRHDENYFLNAAVANYQGEFVNGLKHGEGKEIFPDNSQYVGHFENGFAHGKGVMKYGDGSKYDGNWERGYYHGEGKWTGSDKSSYVGEWKEGVAHGEGIRKTALGNEFEGLFENGRPVEGFWTSPDMVKTPYLAETKQEAAKTAPHAPGSNTDAYLVVAMEMYLHVIIGLILAYYIGYFKIWGFHLDMMLMIPIVETIVQFEKMFPRIKAMTSHTKSENPEGSQQESRTSHTLRLDQSLLEKLFIQSRMDTIDVEYEWFNYTLAQFWHTYDAWLGQYIRMLIESSIGNMRFITLETCTLGQSPITVTNMRSMARNNDPQLKEERAQDAETTDEDLIVDLYFDIDWRSDAMIKLKLWGLIPISIQDIFLKASMRVVLQWVALDHNDPGMFPNLAYLGLESLGRADLSLSLYLFGFFDVFSIPPFATLLGQDFLLDVLYDFLGPGTGFWLDFLRGRATEPFAILDSRIQSKAAVALQRKAAGDVKGLKEATKGSKLKVSVTVVSSQDHIECSPFCVLRMGTKAQIEAKEAKDIEKQTAKAKVGKFACWNTETFSWLSNPATDSINEDWLSIALMSSSLMGSPSQVGIWKKSLSEIIHQYDLVPNGPPQKVACPLTVPIKDPKEKKKTVESEHKPTLCVEFCLTCLGVPELVQGGKEGEQLMAHKENIQQFTGIVHIQLRDCHHLHHKMNPDLRNSSVKLEPYVKFYVGSRKDFESSFGKYENLEKGMYLRSRTEKIDQQRFNVQQSKHIAAGQEMVWNEHDGKFIFDTEVPAIDLCILAQVYHRDTVLGQAFVEVKHTVFDSKTNRFVLKTEQMIQVLCNEDHLIICYHGDTLKRDYWAAKPFEELVKHEIPLMTLLVSFTPKTYTRPSVKVVVMRAGKLPKMDAFIGKADPFVIVYLGKDQDSANDPAGVRRFQTKVIKRTLDPVWMEDNVFNINLDTDNWKEETLKFIVMDHEMAGAPREIGSWKENLIKLFTSQYDTCKKSMQTMYQGQEVELALTNANGKNVGNLYCNISFLGDFWEKTVAKELH